MKRIFIFLVAFSIVVAGALLFSAKKRNQSNKAPTTTKSVTSTGDLQLQEKDSRTAGTDGSAAFEGETLTPLHSAAAMHHWSVVRQLIKDGAVIGGSGKSSSPLMLAAEFHLHPGRRHHSWNSIHDRIDPDYKESQGSRETLAETVEHLAKLGMKMDASGPNGNTLMHYAAIDYDAALLDTLAKKYGLNANVKNARGETPLVFALNGLVSKSAGGDDLRLTTIQWLIKNGVDVNARDERGRTVAFDVVSRPVLLALMPGLDINVADNEGYSIWSGLGYYSMKFAQTQATLSAPRMTDGRMGRGPLHVAAKDGRLDQVLYFIQRGVDVNQPDQDDVTPLHEVLRSSGGPLAGGESANGNRLIMVKALLNAGANPNMRTSEGLTPLMAAVDKPGEFAQVLLDHKADVNGTVNLRGKPESVIDMYYRRGNSAGIEVLLKAGAKNKN